MEWVGWIIALIGIAAALGLLVALRKERAHAGELLYAKIDAENRAEALLEQQAQVRRSAQHANASAVVADAMPVVARSLRESAAHLDDLSDLLGDYRTRVNQFDAAVQYCLQPVELIFGADKAGLDQLVQHVEGARRKLFETRAALEKSPLHRRDGPLLDGARDALRAHDDTLGGLGELLRPSTAADEAVDVAACIDQILRLLAPRLGTRIDVHREVREVPVLRTSRSALRELVLALLDNALRAMGEEGTLGVALRPGDGGHIELVVSDTGGGIADETLPVIFDAYFTTRAGENAAGLGLTRAQEITQALGGSIVVRSTRGHGATFTVTLPVQTRAAPAGRLSRTTPTVAPVTTP